MRIFLFSLLFFICNFSYSQLVKTDENGIKETSHFELTTNDQTIQSPRIHFKKYYDGEGVRLVLTLKTDKTKCDSIIFVFNRNLLSIHNISLKNGMNEYKMSHDLEKTFITAFDTDNNFKCIVFHVGDRIIALKNNNILVTYSFKELQLSDKNTE